MQDDVEQIIDQPFDVDRKINSVSYAIWQGISHQVYAEIDKLAEQIVFGQISWPSVIEIQCKTD